MDPLDRVIFNYWAPYKRSACEDMRLRMRKELCYIEVSKLHLYRESYTAYSHLCLSRFSLGDIGTVLLKPGNFLYQFSLFLKVGWTRSILA